MASRSSPPGKRRRPGQRTEKERRNPQGLGPGSSQDSGAGSPRSAGRGPGTRPGPGGGPGSGTRPRAPGRPATLTDDAPAGAVPAGTTLIYGRNPVREALRGHRQVHAVWLSPGTSGEDLMESVSVWAVEAGKRAPEVRRASPDQLAALVGTFDHQSIVAAVDPYTYSPPEDILSALTLLVALDGVQDPQNLGSIIRTAEGAGAGVVIPRHRAAGVTAAVVKASAGATEHAAVAQVRNLPDFLTLAKEAGFWVYGAAAEAAAGYSDQDYTCPTCFVVGSEGRGLGRRAGSLCDVIVSLPLRGHVDSLNVGVSTGILLYEAVRQRRAGTREGAR